MQVYDDLMLNLNLDDYVAAKERFLELCTKNSITKERIGFFGEIGFPGISDIDAVVISDRSTLRNLRRSHESERANDISYKYMFWHKPVYLLESAVTIAKHLHTFQGVNFLEENKFQITHNESDGNNLLNIIWFIFLLQVLADFYRENSNGNSASLRKFLLIYKNLEYSNKVFYQQEFTQKSYTGSNDLRKNIAKDELELDQKYLFDNLNQLVTEVCANFDVFIANAGISTIDTEYKSIRTINSSIEKSKFTALNKDNPSKIELNENAFSLVVSYFVGFSESENIQKYIDYSNKCKSIYSSNNIQYPFIEPLILPGNFMKLKALKFFNYCGKYISG